MIGRRLLIIVAVLMGLTALAASVAPPPETTRRDRTGASPTPSATTPAPLTAGAPERTVTLDAATGGGRVDLTSGDLVSLRVTSDVADTVVIDGLADDQAVDRDSPAVFDIYADVPGHYPVRLLEADRTVGELVVSAAR